MLFVDLNDNFSCKENYNVSGRSLIMLGFVPYSEVRLREGDLDLLNKDVERWCDLRERHRGTFLTRLLSG